MFVRKLNTRWCKNPTYNHGSLDLIVMTSKGKQQFHTLLAGYFVTFGKFMGNPICHANVNRICFSRANIPSLNSPQGFIGFAAPNQGGTIPQKWYTEKNGCMTLYDYMIPSLPAKKILKITILSKNEPTGTAHVSTTSLQNFWIFWISHEKKQRPQHALALRVLRSITKNMAV